MTRSTEFDDWYRDTRDRLLLEAYALTGDLLMSRGAVRDAFVVAWHQWDKVTRLQDREAWLRPLVWRRARTRHHARPWHKEKGVDEEAAATLSSLASLPTVQRKALVLEHLTPADRIEAARELGLPTAEAEDQLVLATAGFAESRDVPVEQVGAALAGLRPAIEEGRWPRGSIIRRTGAARRRTHTLVGVLGTATAVLVSGVAVAQGGTTGAALADQEFDRPRAEVTEPVQVALEPETLLTVPQVRRQAGPGLDWADHGTGDNTGGDGLVLPCQQSRYADPGVGSALVRTFTGSRTEQQGRGRNGRGQRRTTDVARAAQTMELSISDEAARQGYRTQVDWLAACSTRRTQLMSVHELPGVGDESVVFTLRNWRGTTSTMHVGVARTGRLVTTVMRERPGTELAPRPAATLLTQAVGQACATEYGGACATRSRLRQVGVPLAGTVPGMLSEFDLPPVSGARGPWVATPPERARTNQAATRCDDTSFRGRGVRFNLTRDFLFPAVQDAREFGLTQTVGRMRNPRLARNFVQGVRNRIANCADDGFGTEVTRLVDQSNPRTDLTIWQVDVELSDTATLRYLMAIMRHRGTVSQVGFVPSRRMSMSRDDFSWVARRALERLPRLRLEDANG